MKVVQPRERLAGRCLTNCCDLATIDRDDWRVVNGADGRHPVMNCTERKLQFVKW